ncbi:MAG: hypothetical protein ACP5NY_08885 [Thermocladium sp.]
MENVYKPAEDSDQTLRTAISLLRKICNNKDEVSIIEIGSGSGYVIGGLSRELHLMNCKHGKLIGIDINPYACKLTMQTMDEIDVIQANLLSSVRWGLDLDIVVFNLPYLLGGNKSSTIDWLDAAIYLDYLSPNLIDELLKQVMKMNYDFIILTYSSESASIIESSLVNYGLRISEKVINHLFFEDIITSIIMK